jgi:hypothetical protein
MLNGPYVATNQLIKSIGKVVHLDNSLTYILGGKKNLDPIKKWPRGTFVNKVQIKSFKSS